MIKCIINFWDGSPFLRSPKNYWDYSDRTNALNYLSIKKFAEGFTCDFDSNLLFLSSRFWWQIWFPCFRIQFFLDWVSCICGAHGAISFAVETAIGEQYMEGQLETPLGLATICSNMEDGFHIFTVVHLVGIELQKLWWFLKDHRWNK